MNEKLEEQEKKEKKPPHEEAAEGKWKGDTKTTHTTYDPAMDKTVTKDVQNEADTSIPEEVNEADGNDFALELDEQVPGAAGAFDELSGEMDDYGDRPPVVKKTPTTPALDTAAKVGAKEDPEPVHWPAAKGPGSTGSTTRTTTKTVDRPFGTGKKGTQTTTLRTGTGEAGKKLAGKAARRGPRAPIEGEPKQDYFNRMKKRSRTGKINLNMANRRWNDAQNESVESRPTLEEAVRHLIESIVD